MSDIRIIGSHSNDYIALRKNIYDNIVKENDSLIAQRDQARNSELNALEAYQRKIGLLEKEVNALRKQLEYEQKEGKKWWRSCEQHIAERNAMQTKLNACELALDDMRLGRAIADNKLDIAREALLKYRASGTNSWASDALEKIEG